MSGEAQATETSWLWTTICMRFLASQSWQAQVSATVVTQYNSRVYRIGDGNGQRLQSYALLDNPRGHPLNSCGCRMLIQSYLVRFAKILQQTVKTFDFRIFLYLPVKTCAAGPVQDQGSALRQDSPGWAGQPKLHHGMNVSNCFSVEFTVLLQGLGVKQNLNRKCLAGRWIVFNRFMVSIGDNGLKSFLKSTEIIF